MDIRIALLFVEQLDRDVKSVVTLYKLKQSLHCEPAA